MPRVDSPTFREIGDLHPLGDDLRANEAPVRWSPRCRTGRIGGTAGVWGGSCRSGALDVHIEPCVVGSRLVESDPPHSPPGPHSHMNLPGALLANVRDRSRACS